jgi:ribosome biogenesis GTPase A
MKRENDLSGPSKALYNWYPGHMAKALREVKKRLNVVDIVLEIRDARVPLASANRELNEGLGQKPKLTIFNKANLCDPDAIAEWSKWFDEQGEPYMYVNCFDKPSMKKAISKARALVEANRRN